MGYIDSTLADNERILAQATFHWTYTLGALIEGGVWLVGAAALWFILSAKELPEYQWATLILVAFAALRFFLVMIKKWSTEIAVTDRRLVYKRGFISRTTQELPLTRIEEVNLSQGILGRIMGYGQLSVSGTGGDTSIEIPSIDDPLEFRVGIANARALAEPNRGPNHT